MIRFGLNRLLPTIAVALYLFAMAWTSSPSSKVLFLAFPVLVFVGFRFFTSFKFAAYTTILLSTLNTLSTVVSQPLLQPDKLVVLLGCVSILFMFHARKKVFTSSEVLLFVVFIVYTFGVSYFKSPVYGISVSGIFQLTIAFLGFLVVLQLKNYNRPEILKFIKYFAIIGVLQTVYGLISFYAWVGAGIPLGGVMFNQGGDSVTIRGTVVEANLYGSLIGALLLISISLLFSDKIRSKKWWAFFSLLLFAGLIFSWTRSAWIGFGVGLLILGVYLGRRLLKPQTLVRIALIAVFVIAPIFMLLQHQFDSASEEGQFTSKFQNLLNPDEGTGQYRVNQYEFAYKDIGNNQLFGKGYYSIKKYGDSEWIGNTFLSIYHDTGIIGAVIFLFILISVFVKSIKFIRNPRFEWNDRLIAMGMLTGFLLLLISYNFSPGHILSFFWVYTGLLVTYVTSENVKEAEA